MAGWAKLESMVRDELRQCEEEGRDAEKVAGLREEHKAAGDDEAKLRDIWSRVLSLPIRDDFPFEEPNGLDDIRALRPDGPRRLEVPSDDDFLFDRLHGAWLGRCAGCALGKPVEGFMGGHEGLSSKDRIKEYLTAISPDEWPLNYYFPAHSPAEEKTGSIGCPQSQREGIKFMESDDDIRYTVIGQIVLAKHGHGFSSDDVMNAWIGHLPYGYVCTAETQAYRNYVMRYQTHCGGAGPADWSWVAANENPYREWIGAQIRADQWGYAAPGEVELAAEYAWRDARISHVKNGIYGEMFCAAMIAAAFALDDPVEIVKAGLAEIPKTSRLHKDMVETVDTCARHGNDPVDFEAVFDELYAKFDGMSAVHTNNNAALVVASLLLGVHDFEKVIAISVMGGWDTDCNGATAGSIAGAMLGAKRLPAKWIDPLHDKLNSNIIDYHPIAISDVARKSVEIVKARAAK
jgi:hypothetical protein